MPSYFDSDRAFTDNDTGAIIALGTVYFGLPNQDPETNPKKPYSDATLATAVSATQALDASGKLPYRLYLSGPYSITVKTAGGALVYTNPLTYGDSYADIPSSFQGQRFIATAGQTDFTTSFALEANVFTTYVAKNGSDLWEGVDYTIPSSNLIRLTSGATAGDEITVVASYPLPTYSVATQNISHTPAGGSATDLKSYLDSEKALAQSIRRYPSEWGAAGDGSTNDTQAFIDMFVELGDTPKVIDLGGLSYLLNDLIPVPANTTFIGHKQAKIVTNDNILYLGTNEVPIFLINGKSNVFFWGVNFEMLEAAGASYTGHPIRVLGGGSGGTGTPVTLYNKSGTAFTGTGSSIENILVDECTFTNWGNWQFVASYAAFKNVHFTRNKSYKCIRGAIIGYGPGGSGIHCSISDNLFEFADLTVPRTTPVPVAIKVDGYITDTEVKSNTIKGSEANYSATGVFAIEVETECRRIFLEDNTCNGNLNGFVQIGLGQVDATNNQQGPCFDVYLTRNQCSVPGLGVYAVMPKGLYLTDNILHSTTLTPLAVDRINPASSPWAADANTAYWRTNYSAAPYAETVKVSGGKLSSGVTTAGKYCANFVYSRDVSLGGVKCEGGQIAVTGTNVVGLQLDGVRNSGSGRGLDLEASSDISVVGGRLEGDDQMAIELRNCSDFIVSGSKLVNNSTNQSMVLTTCTNGIVTGTIHDGAGINTYTNCVNILFHGNLGDITVTDDGSGTNITNADDVVVAISI